MASGKSQGSYWPHALLAALLLAAPSTPRLAAEASTAHQQALPPHAPQLHTAAGTISFSELAEVTTANVSGLLPLVARSVAAERADPGLDLSTAMDLPLQRFVDERTAAFGPRGRERAAASGGLNRVVSYQLEGEVNGRERHLPDSLQPQLPARELRAWDPIERHVLWSVHEALPISSGTLITAGGLVFYGTGDGWFKALDARTGRTLWQHRVEGKRLDAPATYRGADGHQYVAVRVLAPSPADQHETVLLFALAH